MVSTALREYRMDIVTNDMRTLRHALQAKGAPADYELSQGLETMQLTGGAALTWRNHPVSMVCFDRGNKSRPAFQLGGVAVKPARVTC